MFNWTLNFVWIVHTSVLRLNGCWLVTFLLQLLSDESMLCDTRKNHRKTILKFKNRNNYVVLFLKILNTMLYLASLQPTLVSSTAPPAAAPAEFSEEEEDHQ